MPIYENVCDACNSEKETIQSIDDMKRPSCPKCNKEMRRKFARNPLFLGDLCSKRHFKASDYGRSGL